MGGQTKPAGKSSGNATIIFRLDQAVMAKLSSLAEAHGVSVHLFARALLTEAVYAVDGPTGDDTLGRRLRELLPAIAGSSAARPRPSGRPRNAIAVQPRGTATVQKNPHPLAATGYAAVITHLAAAAAELKKATDAACLAEDRELHSELFATWSRQLADNERVIVYAGDRLRPDEEP
jgi:plasmid stability protein